MVAKKFGKIAILNVKFLTPPIAIIEAMQVVLTAVKLIGVIVQQAVKLVILITAIIEQLLAFLLMPLVRHTMMIVLLNVQLGLVTLAMKNLLMAVLKMILVIIGLLLFHFAPQMQVAPISQIVHLKLVLGAVILVIPNRVQVVLGIP